MGVSGGLSWRAIIIRTVDQQFPECSFPYFRRLIFTETVIGGFIIVGTVRFGEGRFLSRLDRCRVQVLMSQICSHRLNVADQFRDLQPWKLFVSLEISTKEGSFQGRIENANFCVSTD